MRLTRGGWALTALASVSVVTLAPDTLVTAADLREPSFPTVLEAGAALALLAVSGWILGAVTLTALAGRSALTRILAPSLLRRALFVSAAGALVLAPAHADRGVAPPDHSVAGLRLPDRPNEAPVGDVEADAGPTRAPGEVVVRAGDTLWAIAARSVPADATDAEIARACARWHDANRDVIGDDPDLIFPQQRLTPPSGKDHP